MTTAVQIVQVCKITLQDISKALRNKPGLLMKQTRDRHSTRVKDFVHLITNNTGAVILPPLRGGLDYSFSPMKENEKTLTPQRASLYNISRNFYKF